MKKSIFILATLFTVNLWAQARPILHSTCNAKISLSLRTLNAQTMTASAPNMVPDWFIDTSGKRPSAFKSADRLKYDSIRSFIDKGYTLTPVMQNQFDPDSVKAGELLIVMHLSCSADLASAFCGTAVELYEANKMTSDKVEIFKLVGRSAPSETEGRGVLAIYNSIKTASSMLPNCKVQ